MPAVTIYFCLALTQPTCQQGVQRVWRLSTHQEMLLLPQRKPTRRGCLERARSVQVSTTLMWHLWTHVCSQDVVYMPIVTYMYMYHDLAIICLFVWDMVGWVALPFFSFLFFFKLVCYAHVFPCSRKYTLFVKKTPPISRTPSPLPSPYPPLEPVRLYDSYMHPTAAPTLSSAHLQPAAPTLYSAHLQPAAPTLYSAHLHPAPTAPGPSHFVHPPAPTATIPSAHLQPLMPPPSTPPRPSRQPQSSPFTPKGSIEGILSKHPLERHAGRAANELAEKYFFG